MVLVDTVVVVMVALAFLGCVAGVTGLCTSVVVVMGSVGFVVGFVAGSSVGVMELCTFVVEAMGFVGFVVGVMGYDILVVEAMGFVV